MSYADPLKAGFGRSDITPHIVDHWVDVDHNAQFEPKKGDRYIDVNHNGKFDAFWMAGFDNGRAANGVHDPLWAIATVLDDGHKRIAIAVIDAIGFFYNDVQDVRKRIQKEWKIDHVVICSTHSHEVPDLMGMWGEKTTSKGVNLEYLEQVKTGIVNAIGQAVQTLTPAKMELAEIKLTPDEGFLRDSRTPEVFDPNIRLMRFLDASTGKTLGSIVNWADHPETLWSQNLDISADFVGYIRDGIEKGIRYNNVTKVPGVGGTHLYINGAIGGLMTTDRTVSVHDAFLNKDFKDPSHEKARAQGYSLANRILHQWKKNDWIEVDQPTIEFRVNTFTLPVDNWKFKLAGQLGILRRNFVPLWQNMAMRHTLFPGYRVETEINNIRIGEAEIQTIPGEVYPELVNGGVTNPPGADYKMDISKFVPIRDQMKGEVKFIFGLANDELGYIVPKSEWDDKKPFVKEKGKQYGEDNSVGPKTGEILMQQIQKLLSDEPPLYTGRAYELHRIHLPPDQFQDEPYTLDFYESTTDYNEFKGKKRPLVLVGEILGGNDEVTRWFAPLFAQSGFHVLVVHTPKVNATINQIQSYSDLPKLKGLIERTISLYRSGLDWVVSRSEVDSHRMGVFGISLGAMMTSYLMATDTRIQAGYFALTGSDPSGILTYSTEPGLVHLRKRMWAHEHPGQSIQKSFYNELERKLNALNLPDINKLKVANEKRLTQGARIVYAQLDQVVPPRYTNEQWLNMGKPKKDTLWLVGHYRGSFLYVPWVQKTAVDWFKDKLTLHASTPLTARIF